MLEPCSDWAVASKIFQIRQANITHLLPYENSTLSKLLFLWIIHFSATTFDLQKKMYMVYACLIMMWLTSAVSITPICSPGF